MHCFRQARSADIRRGRSARNCQRVDGDGAVRLEDKRIDVDPLSDHSISPRSDQSRQVTCALVTSLLALAAAAASVLYARARHP